MTNTIRSGTGAIALLLMGTLFSPLRAHAIPGTQAAPGQWDLVTIEPEKVSVIPFFQEGEMVRLTLEERLPNSCYQLAPVDADIELTQHQIHLRDQAFLENGSLCAMVVLPMSRSLELGTLPEGAYEVIVDGPRGDRHKVAEFRVNAHLYRDGSASEH